MAQHDVTLSTRPPLTPLEREERVLRILAAPTRVNAATQAAYDAQRRRVAQLRAELATMPAARQGEEQDASV